ncbi:MAG: thioredoxin domain-containing protein [Deltaproteobacteria bacterium]|nr:MAG: thioredoxin domain-containing protein [Deltaproteobacteria bacterium]
MLEKYPEEVKLVYKNFPLKNHKFAWQAAVAALAAGRQGKFWEFHDRLFENYKQLSDQKIQEIARLLNLDIKRFQEDMKDPEIVALVRQDVRDGGDAGVRGIPTIFINGRQLRNRNLEDFQVVIEKQLKKMKK